MIAWPVASLANRADHQGHFLLTFAHIIGGTGALFLGALNLYLVARKDRFRLHRRIGQSYLLLGAFGAITALFVALSPAHKSGPILTNATISLVMLAAAWLAFAALGWRAARNRKFASHGDWMIRTYVLTWAFVFCRIASRTTDIDQLGNGEGFIWALLGGAAHPVRDRAAMAPRFAAGGPLSRPAEYGARKATRRLTIQVPGVTNGAQMSASRPSEIANSSNGWLARRASSAASVSLMIRATWVPAAPPEARSASSAFMRRSKPARLRWSARPRMSAASSPLLCEAMAR